MLKQDKKPTSYRIKTKSAVPSEAQEQRWLVKWIKMQPKLRDFLIKLNNEGRRTPIQGHQLKLLGMRPGASDLFLAYPTQRHHGIWLEVKKNRIYTRSEMDTATWVSESAFVDLMRSVGFAAYFCFGWEHGKMLIDEYLSGDAHQTPEESKLASKV